MQPTPALVRLDVWGVPTAAIPRALLRMGAHRLLMPGVPGVGFWKLMGTGSGQTFTTRDADLHHWALLTTWSEATDAQRLDSSKIADSWARVSNEHLVVEMTPITSKGRWAGQQPFGQPEPQRVDGPVAALTRARIKTSMWPQFWRNVPPVSADLLQDPGLLLSMGIGEAPVGLQGTFSVWRNHQAISDFAYRRSPHAQVIRRTSQLDWYAEELFARFELKGIRGSYQGEDISARIRSSQ